MPDEVSRLSDSRGALRPLGPLLYAEAESRIYTEILSQHLLGMRDGDPVRQEEGHRHARWLIQRLSEHLSGWYGLSDASAFLEGALALLEGASREETPDYLEEVVLYLSRLNLWLDLLIPWNELNLKTIRLLAFDKPSLAENLATNWRTDHG